MDQRCALPVNESDRSWTALKAQWKKEAESAGDDFSAYAIGSFPTLDPLALQAPPKSDCMAFMMATMSARCAK
jgi:hypothetical protein